jgi:hypothetical protein
MAVDVIRERLANQFLTGPGLPGPVEVVRRLGAVQAQDYTGAKWAVGQRTKSATNADVEGAVSRGEILRTHVLRPTWHFVLPEDIRWMLALTGPRIAKAMHNYNEKLGLTAALFRKSSAIIEKALRDGAHLTRTELGEILRRNRIPDTSGTRLAHLMMQAELDALVCSGPCRGKQFTYGLLDLRAPAGASIDRDEALGRLAVVYFKGRGPATTHDFAWWSGLTMGDSRRAIEIAGTALTPVRVGEKQMWMVERESPAPPVKRRAHLLPNYDEYFIGHRDRSAIGHRLEHVDPVTGGDASISNVVFINGELVGGWKRTPHGAVVTPHVKLSPDEKKWIDGEIKRFAAFLA